jgi:hypothetical protein
LGPMTGPDCGYHGTGDQRAEAWDAHQSLSSGILFGERSFSKRLAVSRGRLHYAWNEPREVELNAEIGLANTRQNSLGTVSTVS